MGYDKIIIGAGIYGLYSALICGRKGEKVIVLEKEDAACKRASYINQARLHMGYHYPRSYSTAIKTAKYFQRFNREYGFCLLKKFDQIYAIAKKLSWTNVDQFKKFCKSIGIKCNEVNNENYFKDNMCDGSFLAMEYTYDIKILCDYFLNEIKKYKNIKIMYNSNIKRVKNKNKMYEIELENNNVIKSNFVLNTTYASVNQILNKFGYEPFKIKYELCEIILCSVSKNLKNIGITIMDGPFFSIMPFGKTGYHSLTSVSFTPHITSYSELPTFECQKRSKGYCTKEKLGNCNNCPAKPESAWKYMSTLAKKYLKDEYEIKYKDSLFAIKPILVESKIDDSRPTVIKQSSKNPTFISVLSGKFNTIYDLDEVLKNDKK